MSGASAVQMQSLQDVLQIGVRPSTLLKKDPKQVFSYVIYEIFKNTFFYGKLLPWWLLLAVNSVNQWKHTLKVYAAEKEMIYLNITSKVIFSS